MNCPLHQDPLWTADYDGPAGLSDMGRGIASSRLGEVYVGGFETRGTEWDRALFVRKYGGAERLLWHTTYAPDQGVSSGEDLAVDNEDNVIVVGSESDRAGELEPSVGLIVKLGGSQDVLWTRTIGDKSSAINIVRGVASGPHNQVVIVGAEYDLSGIFQQGWIRQYDRDGRLEWMFLFHGFFLPHAVSLDSGGHAYVVGDELGSNTDPSSKVARISRVTDEGILDWTDYPETASGSVSGGSDIVVGKNDIVAAVGYEQTGSGQVDYWVEELSLKGDPLLRLSDLSIAIDVTTTPPRPGVAMDETGNVYLTAFETSAEVSATTVLSLRVYDDAGALLCGWTDPRASEGVSAFIDPVGALLVTGDSPAKNVWVSKYQPKVSP